MSGASRLRTALLMLAMLATASPVAAALSIGAKAPDFSAQASLGGKTFSFHLADALKRGPVVLYFYPAAFTRGCTIEAHDFADAIGRYTALGATVIGISHDDIATLTRFSVSECRSKFAVAADPGLAIAKSYDAILGPIAFVANRTSYVIAPDGTIIESYTDLHPDDHVARTLAALRAWRSAHPPRR